MSDGECMMNKRHFIILLTIMLIVVCVVLAGLPKPVSAEPARLNLRSYPVIPSMRGAVRSHVATLVRVGKRRGNHLNVFTKVGDSISAWDFYLKPIGQGQVQLGNYGDLGEVIGRFSEPVRGGNSFVNQSFAAAGHWSSANVLDPASADPSMCAPGETPIACELRVTQPAVALIMLGTNDVVETDVRTFRNNLNKIVTIIERNGTIPVLSTIPYRRDDPTFQDRIPAFNEAIVRVALAHAVPIWNYWLAIDGLPSNGVSIDGIHPSVPADNNTAIFDDYHLQFGFTMRNLTALQVLKALMPILR
jgi:hypothetical protein